MFNNTLQCEYYTVEDFPNILNTIAKNGGIKLCGTDRHNRYLDISASFDIETTNFKTENKLALMYIWQFAITDDTTGIIYPIVGRTWEDFILLVDIINNIMACCGDAYNFYFPIYIHNFSFEYFFIKHYIDILETFVTKSNTPLYARTKYIEFRCSYFLSGCGLASLPNFIDNLDPSIKKLVGDLDYSKIRTPETELTDEEIAYCLNDVRLLNAYISQKRKEDGDISNISLTKTGYARRFVNKITMGDDANRKIHKKTIKELEFHNGAEFQAVTKAYMGGHTAANPLNNGIILEDVTCYDFTSSYPAVMVYSDNFPISYICSKSNMNEQQLKIELGLNHAVVAKFKFTHIRPYVNKNGSLRNFDSFIPSSKCLALNGERLNNGKVESADYLEIYATDMDFRTYELMYKWDIVELENVHIYKTGYLPRNTIMAVLQLYEKKTTLKGVEGKELEYTLSKELLNALYGMSVTSPLKDVLAFDGKKWRPQNKHGWIDEIYKDKEEKYLEDKINEYNRRINRGKISIPYIQGIYISAIARYNLSLGIVASGVKDLFCYSDTDSIYVQYADNIKDFITDYNTMIEQKMLKMCKYYGFNENVWRPKSIDGEEKPLGYWDFDGHSKYFKTLGAKRYIKLDDNDNFKITIAGLGKKDGAVYLSEYDDAAVITGKNITLKNYKKVFDAFKIGLEIPAERTGKLTHTIFSGDYKGTLIDYKGKEYKYHILGGVNLEPASFEMSMSKDYIAFLEHLSDYTQETYYN